VTEQFPNYGQAPKPISPKWQYLGAAVAVGLLGYLGSWAYELVTRDISGVPVVRAAEGPLRVVPQDRDAPQPEYQGLSVNDVVSGGNADDAPASVALAPEPLPVDESDLLSLAQSQQAQQEIERQAATPLPELESESVPAPIAPPKPEPVIVPQPQQPMMSAEDVAILEQSLAQIRQTEQSAPAAPTPPSAPQSTPIPQLRPQTIGAQPPQAVVAAQPQTPPAVAAVSAPRDEVPAGEVPDDEFVAQLVVLGSLGAARDEWQKIAARHVDLFADKQRVVMEIERNGSIMYRLRVAGFVDRNAARDFCLNLKARGQDCIATRMR
jgi:hypothetical protein